MTIATDKTEHKVWTDIEFMALPNDEGCYELVDGQLVNMGNSGMEHGYLASVLTFYLGGYVIPRKLGVLCDSSTAFTLASGNQRSPDVSFVAKEQLQGVKLSFCT